MAGIESWELLNTPRDLTDILSTLISQRPIFLNKFPRVENATNVKKEWLEDVLKPRSVAFSAFNTSTGAATVADTTGWEVGDYVRVKGDSAIFKVTAVVANTSLTLGFVASNGSATDAIADVSSASNYARVQGPPGSADVSAASNFVRVRGATGSADVSSASNSVRVRGAETGRTPGVLSGEGDFPSENAPPPFGVRNRESTIFGGGRQLTLRNLSFFLSGGRLFASFFDDAIVDDAIVLPLFDVAFIFFQRGFKKPLWTPANFFPLRFRAHLNSRSRWSLYSYGSVSSVGTEVAFFH